MLEEQEFIEVESVTEQKPGWKTTEFWLTLFAAGAGVLVATGVLSNEDVVTLQELIMGVVLAVLPIWEYIKSRTEVKTAYAHK